MTRALAVLALLTGTTVGRADDALQAGFGEADITPAVGGDKLVYMAGFGHNRKATGVHDPLKARAVVLKHGQEKVALACVDLVGFFLPNVEHVRRAVARLRLCPRFQHAQPRGAGHARPVGADAVPERRRRRLHADRREADRPGGARRRRRGASRSPLASAPSGRRNCCTTRANPTSSTMNWSRWNFATSRTTNRPASSCSGTAIPKRSGASQHGDQRRFRRLHGQRLARRASLSGRLPDRHGRRPDDLAARGGEGRRRQGAGGRHIREDGALRPIAGGGGRPGPEGRQAGAADAAGGAARPVFLPMDNKIYMLARQLGVLDREAFLWTGDPYKAEPAGADEGRQAAVPCAPRSASCGWASWKLRQFPGRYIRNWCSTRCRTRPTPAPTSRTPRSSRRSTSK